MIFSDCKHSRIEKLAAQAAATGAPIVIVPTDEARKRFIDAWPGRSALPEIRVGAEALVQTVSDTPVTTVMPPRN